MLRNKYPEFFLNCFIKLIDSSSISSMIGSEDLSLELEFPLSELNCSYRGRRVDLFARDELNREVYVECQLGPSDDKHLSQNKNLVDCSDNSTIVWIASSFSEQHKRSLLEYVVSSRKSIDIYFVEISTELTFRLESLRDVPFKNIRENLHILKEEPDRFLLNDVYKSDSRSSCPAPIPLPSAPTSELEAVNRKIMFIANIYSNNLNFSRYRGNLNTREVSVGGGRAGIALYFCYMSLEGSTYVGYRFSQEGTRFFYILLENKAMIERYVGETLFFNVEEKRIIIYFNEESSSENVRILWIVSRLNKLYYHTSDFFFNY